MRLLRLVCGDCGRRLAEIYDEPPDQVRFVWANRRPTDDTYSGFANFTNGIPQPDPQTLSPASVRRVVVHCYNHPESRGRKSSLRWKDLEQKIREARRTSKTLTVRCAMTTTTADI